MPAPRRGQPACCRASDDPAASRPGSLRAVEVASITLGVTGRCDRLETGPDGQVTVVEHKATPVRRKAEVTEAMTVQLALQVQALREDGYRVAGAAVYFTHHQARVPVPIGDPELNLARTHAEQTARMLAGGRAPEPLEDDPRCTRCSHAGACLPDEGALGPVRRRVLAADPDTQVLHLATPGSRAYLRAGRVRIEKAREEIGSVPVERILALVLHGNIDLSAALIREMLWRRCPVLWCSGTGRLIGWAVPAASPSGGPRVARHVASAAGHLGLAREFITAKIANQATLLRRHGEAPGVVRQIRELQARARKAASLPELLGIEGEAAARYFSAFETMFSPAVRAGQGISLSSRTRRPALHRGASPGSLPADPVGCRHPSADGPSSSRLWPAWRDRPGPGVSPSLSGRPFIEASPGRCSAPGPGSSPSLSGRPLIEALKATADLVLLRNGPGLVP